MKALNTHEIRNILIAVSLVTLIALFFITVPVIANNNTDNNGMNRINTENETGLITNLLVVQDKAKVEALIARALDSGRITPEQAVRIKDAWVANYQKATVSNARLIMQRLITMWDKAKVEALIARALDSGRITPEQAVRIKDAWVANYQKATVSNARLIMQRLITMWDKAKVEALIARALESGRITPEQAVRIKDAWVANYQKEQSPKLD